MSEAGEREFLSFKLSFLKQQNQQLLAATQQEHVQSVLTTVQQWLDSSDGSESFTTLNQKVENCISFVTESKKAVQQCSKCINESLAPFSSSQLQAVETNIAVKSVAEAGRDKLQGSEQTGVPDSLKNLIGRVCVIEEAFSSLKASTEKINQNQNSAEENLRGTSDKQEQQAKKMEEIEKKVKQLSSKKAGGLKEINEKVSNQDTELSLLKGKQTEMMKQLDVMEKREKKMEAEMDELSEDIAKAEEETMKQKEIIEKQIDEVKKKIQEVSTSVNGRVDKLSALTSSIDVKIDTALEATKKTVEDLSNKTQTMQSNVDVLQQMDTPLKQLSDKVDAVESQVKAVTKNVEQNSSSIKKQVQKGRKDRDLLGKYIDRLVVVELQRVKDMEETTKNHEEVSEKLESLEELRNILNNKVKARDANVKRLDQLDVKVTSLTGKVALLEKQETTKTAGVQARFPYETQVTIGDILKNYSTMCNTSGILNVGTGEIVVPFDGLAVVGFSIQQEGEGLMHFYVKHKRSTSAGGGEGTVCCVRSSSHRDLRTSMGVYNVQQNDVLYVKVAGQSREAKLGYCRFSCLIIG